MAQPHTTGPSILEGHRKFFHRGPISIRSGQDRRRLTDHLLLGVAGQQQEGRIYIDDGMMGQRGIRHEHTTIGRCDDG